MPKNNNIQQIQFPFKTTLDLSLLIKYWKDNLSTTSTKQIYPTKDIIKRIDEAKSFHKPISDLTELKTVAIL